MKIEKIFNFISDLIKRQGPVAHEDNLRFSLTPFPFRVKANGSLRYQKWSRSSAWSEHQTLTTRIIKFAEFQENSVFEEIWVSRVQIPSGP
jgi:hypothetical protein